MTRDGFPFEQASFDLVPGRVRRGDLPTSRAGARAVAPRAGSQKALLLDAYAEAGARGLTDEEAAAAAHLPLRSCWWKRCGELRQGGFITPTGDERLGEAGSPRIVCRITKEGSAWKP